MILLKTHYGDIVTTGSRNVLNFIIHQAWLKSKIFSYQIQSDLDYVLHTLHIRNYTLLVYNGTVSRDGIHIQIKLENYRDVDNFKGVVSAPIKSWADIVTDEEAVLKASKPTSPKRWR